MNTINSAILDVPLEPESTRQYYRGMSSLTTDDILHLARLANLTLSDDEISSLKTQLSDVISYFEELKEVPTDNVLPTSQTTGLEDVLRDDEVDTTRVLKVEEATSGTDKIHNNYFVVDQVIDKSQ